jgi:hypothetical protein
MTIRWIWFFEVLGSALALVWIAAALDEAGGGFIWLEIGLFTVAFVLSTFVGGPGKILLLGIGIGFTLATVMAIGTSGSCDDDFLCFSPGDVFALGLIFSGALYPGWALGAGVGALARGSSVRGSNR